MQEIHIQCPYCLQAISIVLNNEVFGHNTQIDSCKKCNKKIEISYMTLDLNSGVPRSIIYKDFYSEIAICQECKGKGYKTYGFFKDTPQESKKLCTNCDGLGRYKVSPLLYD